MGGREGSGREGYERVDGMGGDVDGATFDVSHHRGVGAMEIVAMDMKVSCHGNEGQLPLPNSTSHESQSSTEVPSSVSVASSEGCMQPASSALLV